MRRLMLTLAAIGAVCVSACTAQDMYLATEDLRLESCATLSEQHRVQCEADVRDQAHHVGSGGQPRAPEAREVRDQEPWD